MKYISVLILTSITAWSSLVDDRFLKAVSLIESGGKPNAKGDYLKGVPRALGEFQFWRSTWDSVTAMRRSQGLPTKPYHTGATTSLSTEYARTYLKWCEKGLKRNGVKSPTRGQIYAAYNCGLTSFKRRGCKLSRCPSHTQRAAERIERLCRK